MELAREFASRRARGNSLLVFVFSCSHLTSTPDIFSPNYVTIRIDLIIKSRPRLAALAGILASVARARPLNGGHEGKAKGREEVMRSRRDRLGHETRAINSRLMKSQSELRALGWSCLAIIRSNLLHGDGSRASFPCSQTRQTEADHHHHHHHQASARDAFTGSSEPREFSTRLTDESGQIREQHRTVT